jgi:hypothetical protein
LSVLLQQKIIAVIGKFGSGDDSSMVPKVGKKPSAAVVCSAVLHRMGAEGCQVGLVDLSNTPTSPSRCQRDDPGYGTSFSMS